MPKYRTTATCRITLDVTVDVRIGEHDDEDDEIRAAIRSKLDPIRWREGFGSSSVGDIGIEIIGKGEAVFDSI